MTSSQVVAEDVKVEPTGKSREAAKTLTVAAGRDWPLNCQKASATRANPKMRIMRFVSREIRIPTFLWSTFIDSKVLVRIGRAAGLIHSDR
ncbi:MAG: hypothetical protein KGL41_02990 [Actinomycetales bacterium]|nr:hypothetical protein [Actinomycetales bacterium]